MKILKNILIIVLFVLTVFAVYTAIARIAGLPEMRWFGSKKTVEIENTPIIIREMREIAQLLTQQYYDECIVDTIYGEKVSRISALKLMFPLVISQNYYVTETELMTIEKRYVLIASGLVKAGFDLKTINENDIYIEDDSLSITLPEPIITDVIINPSGFETFEESGFWTFNERKEIQRKARILLEKNAIAKGILPKSKEHGINLLQKFFKSLGYQKVGIIIK